MCAVVVEQNEVRNSLGAQSIPVRQGVTGHNYCVVLCGIRCSVNLHQFRLAILKMSPRNAYHLPHRHQVAPVVTQHGWPCRCHTRCLPSPRCRMKQCLLIIFDTAHFDTWKWATVSLTGFAFNVTLTLTICDCHDIALVAFWLSRWHLGYTLRIKSIDWIQFRLIRYCLVISNNVPINHN